MLLYLLDHAASPPASSACSFSSSATPSSLCSPTALRSAEAQLGATNLSSDLVGRRCAASFSPRVRAPAWAAALVCPTRWNWITSSTGAPTGEATSSALHRVADGQPIVGVAMQPGHVSSHESGSSREVVTPCHELRIQQHHHSAARSALAPRSSRTSRGPLWRCWPRRAGLDFELDQEVRVGDQPVLNEARAQKR